MSETSGDVVGKTKSGGKRKASGKTAGAPRAPKVNLIAAAFGERVAIASKAYFKPRPNQKAELMSALKAKAKGGDPAKVEAIQAKIAKLTAKLNAAANSEAIIEKYRAPLQSITDTIYGGTDEEGVI